jgi:hypothetical protein
VGVWHNNIQSPDRILTHSGFWAMFVSSKKETKLVLYNIQVTEKGRKTIPISDLAVIGKKTTGI